MMRSEVSRSPQTAPRPEARGSFQDPLETPLRPSELELQSLHGVLQLMDPNPELEVGIGNLGPPQPAPKTDDETLILLGVLNTAVQALTPDGAEEIFYGLYDLLPADDVWQGELGNLLNELPNATPEELLLTWVGNWTAFGDGLGTYYEPLSEVLEQVRRSDKKKAQDIQPEPEWVETLLVSQAGFFASLQQLDAVRGGMQGHGGGTGTKAAVIKALKAYEKQFGLKEEWPIGEELRDKGLAKKAAGFFNVMRDVAATIALSKKKDFQEMNKAGVVEAILDWAGKPCHNQVIGDLLSRLGATQ
ncbi:MAG: hypothetical protein KDD47_25950 [Acidobacteria bacterium]|nr:hypothetical protein [Acidobacteriota bacterium]